MKSSFFDEQRREVEEEGPEKSTKRETNLIRRGVGKEMDSLNIREYY